MTTTFIEIAKQRHCHVVYAEGEHPKILQAARKVVDQGIASVSLIGKESSISESADNTEVLLTGISVIDPSTDDRLADYAELYLRTRDNTKPGIANRMMRKPLYFASQMVNNGDADLVVAGIANPTRRVIEAASLCIGFADGITTPSSFFLMQVPNRSTPLLFADCAVNIKPDAKQLADIAVASARNAKQLLDDVPRVAMLSFSTHGSADHDEVTKVTEALAIAKQMTPEIVIDGELQADAALSTAVAAAKLKTSSEVAGRANVLIFPDLNTGNISYKLVQQLSDAKAIGPILQGFAKPVADLSRGASVDEIVATTVVTIAANAAEITRD